LWVGGLFPAAGNRAAASLARWIESPQVRLEPPRRAPDGGWEIVLQGLVGLRYRAEVGEDLRNWSVLAGGFAETDPVVVRDTEPASARFYRVALEE
jgi:hypothetical protein